MKLGFKLCFYHPLGDPAKRDEKNILKAGSLTPTLQKTCKLMV